MCQIYFNQTTLNTCKSLGYTLFKVKGKVILTLPVVVIGWILSLTCLAALVYGLGEQGLVVPASAFYVRLTTLKT